MLPSRRQGIRGDRGNTVSKLGVSKHESVKKTQFRLRLHDQNYLGGDELLVNPDFFPDVRGGDMVRISVMENEGRERTDSKFINLLKPWLTPAIGECRPHVQTKTRKRRQTASSLKSRRLKGFQQRSLSCLSSLISSSYPRR
mmetsp:Transcript_18707/g.75187  ORF Transcript_18707/g.75187 Transcript_18707/m.75187 type:complete len:142 (+) Transcript_18707:173-598(+)